MLKVGSGTVDENYGAMLPTINQGSSLPAQMGYVSQSPQTIENGNYFQIQVAEFDTFKDMVLMVSPIKTTSSNPTSLSNWYRCYRTRNGNRWIVQRRLNGGSIVTLYNTSISTLTGYMKIQMWAPSIYKYIDFYDLQNGKSYTCSYALSGDQYFYVYSSTDSQPQAPYYEYDRLDDWYCSSLEPATVNMTRNLYATSYPQERRLWYASGRLWEVFHDGTNLVYASSLAAGYDSPLDGTTWTKSTVIAASSYGFDIALKFDGTYIHYARCSGTSSYNTPLYYRRGTCGSDGVITWDHSEQVVVPTVSNKAYSYPSITVDSGGRAWIGYRQSTGNPATSWQAMCTKNANTDGTWSPALTKELASSSTYSTVKVMVVPMLDEDVVALWCWSGNQPLNIKKYNGTWQQTKTTTNKLQQAGSFSATSRYDDVHVTYVKYSTRDVIYQKYNSGPNTWGAAETVAAAQSGSSYTTLSVDEGNGDLYCFWVVDGDTDHVYYSVRGGSWVAPVHWFEEPFGVRYGHIISSDFWMEYYILVSWTTSNYPCIVKFALLPAL